MSLVRQLGVTSQINQLWHPPVSFGSIDGSGGIIPGSIVGKDCYERFFAQKLDHFRHAPGPTEETFQQRYFVCDEYWAAAAAKGSKDGNGIPVRDARGAQGAPQGAKGPIFFYAGNEADVSLYLGATGLMWENAQAFKAVLVFAEHRFYGESLPFNSPDRGREYLSTSQALADYARLVTALKKELLTGAEASPVIVFGGSYGGMLGAWLRLKYPHIVHGAVAASAPVLALAGLTRPRPDPESFAATVTRAAGPAGGAAQECAVNVRRAFSVVLSGGGKEEGDHSWMERGSGGSSRSAEASGGRNVPVGVAWGTRGDAMSDVARMLRVCPGSEPQGEGALTELAYWARAAFDYLAMGNYPYATGYILNEDEVTLPPWPLRKACSYISDPGLETAAEEVLLSALADAIGVYYNATGDLACFSPSAGANNESAVDQDNWNWQACTEMAMPMSTDGVRDMFWRSTPWDPLEQAEGCEKQFGVSSPQDWGAIQYGGYETWSQASNVVFSNGRLDPWSGLGVLDETQVGPNIHIIVIDQSAHHLDLFFENPADPVEVKEARRKEMDLVEDWVRQGYQLVVAPEGATAEMR